MDKLALRYPGYGWEHNAGYPTPDHREAIHRLGLTPHHRRSFGTVRRLMQLSLDLESTGVLVDELDSLDAMVLETEAELAVVGV
jgi:hypothetical protein